MNRKRVTEARLKKAAKIWAFALIAQTDATENSQEYGDWIREEACNFATSELEKFGVTNVGLIQTEQDALDFVLRSSV